MVCMELLDVYNINKERTGKQVIRVRGERLQKGEYIIAVHGWVVNSDGKILLTRRNLNKTHGGMWEPTSGLVVSGETSFQGIKRELREEIGLNIQDNDIIMAKELIEENSDVSFIKDIYIVNKDIDISEISFADGEVIDAKFVSIEEFNTMLTNGECFKHLSYFTDIYYSHEF